MPSGHGRTGPDQGELTSVRAASGRLRLLSYVGWVRFGQESSWAQNHAVENALRNVSYLFVFFALPRIMS